MVLRKSYDTLEETIDSLEELKSYIQKIQDKVQDFLLDNIDKHRNDNNIAVILAYNGSTSSYVEIELDDEDWLEFIQHSWNLDMGGYPSTSKLKFSTLHLNVFYKHFSEIYEGKDYNETVDHKDRNKLNVRKNNLRLATPIQQSQNQISNSRNQAPHYTGVSFSRGKFYARCNWGEKHKKSKGFIYIEDAAREYNRIILEFDENARTNIVPDTKTTIENIYCKENIDEEFVQNMKNINELREIIRIHKDWRKDMGIKRVDDIRIKNLNSYKTSLINIIRNSSRISQPFLPVIEAGEKRKIRLKIVSQPL